MNLRGPVKSCVPTMYSIKGAGDIRCIPVNRGLLLTDLLLTGFYMYYVLCHVFCL